MQYPAKGSPEVSDLVAQAFSDAGIPYQVSTSRGLDHGAFIPMSFVLPDADIPIVHLSIIKSYDSNAHYDIGAALESLRDINVAIIGSGMSYHGEYAKAWNPSEFPPDFVAQMEPNARAFMKDFVAALSADLSIRRERLAGWKDFAKQQECTGGDFDHIMPVRTLIMLNCILLVAACTGCCGWFRSNTAVCFQIWHTRFADQFYLDKRC